MDGGEGPGGGVGGSARRQGFWLHLDFPRMGMTFSVPCTSPCVTYLLSSFHLCIFSPSQQSALLTVGSQYIFTDLVKGWVKKARLYNSSQRNPKMLTNHAAKLLRDAFLCWLCRCWQGSSVWKSGSDVANPFACGNRACCRAISLSSKGGAILASCKWKSWRTKKVQL